MQQVKEHTDAEDENAQNSKLFSIL